MGSRIKSLENKGVQIYFMDFTGLSDTVEITGIIEEARSFIHSQKGNSVYTLTSLQDMHFNADIKNAFVKFIGSNKPYVYAGAVIGLSGLLKIIYNGTNRLTGRKIKAFDKKEDALDWLASS